MMHRALVTGGAGFIGSHLVDKLINEGWDVDIVDDMSNGNIEFIRTRIQEDNFWMCDFSSATILEKIRNKEYEFVFHLAAVPRVSYSVDHPLETNDVNVSKTLALMDACKGNVKRFIFASSSSVYGGADVLPTPESYPKDPKSPYALQKSIIEDYLKLYSRLYGLDSVCLRFFNVFGPRQLGNSPYSTAVSAWLTAVKKEASMRSDGDGSQSRDMCYVDNVVDACFKAASTEKRQDAECYNVACGDRTTNAEILDYLKTRYENAKSHSAPWRAGDVKHTQASIAKTKSGLGYEPLVRFWEGLDRTIKWYDENWDDVKHLGGE
jgi:nucleoside-diphosphate-sugar epimerase